MRCPYCTKPLVSGANRRYENIEDRATNPYAEQYPFRPTWECDCLDSALQFWDEQGYVHLITNNLQLNAAGSFAEKWEKKVEAERLAMVAHLKSQQIMSGIYPEKEE